VLLFVAAALSGCATTEPTPMGVSGTVIDEHQAPVRDCTIMASGRDDQLVPETASVSNANGEFH
jgi:hypothetical protein